MWGHTPSWVVGAVRAFNLRGPVGWGEEAGGAVWTQAGVSGPGDETRSSSRIQDSQDPGPKEWRWHVTKCGEPA